MANLKCKHKRRAMVLPTATVIHRLDGSACDSQVVMLGSAEATPAELVDSSNRFYGGANYMSPFRTRRQDHVYETVELGG